LIWNLLAFVGAVTVIIQGATWAFENGPEWLTEPYWKFRVKMQIAKDQRGLDAEPKAAEPVGPFLVRYDNSKGYGENDQDWVKITEIVVPREFDRQQLLLAFEHIHDIPILDTDIIAVNALAHLYQNPEIIVVR
jgi:hypothetical protein